MQLVCFVTCSSVIIPHEATAVFPNDFFLHFLNVWQLLLSLHGNWHLGQMATISVPNGNCHLFFYHFLLRVHPPPNFEIAFLTDQTFSIIPFNLPNFDNCCCMATANYGTWQLMTPLHGNYQLFPLVFSFLMLLSLQTYFLSIFFIPFFTCFFSFAG